MGTTDDMTTKVSSTGRDQFNTYEYKHNERKIQTSNQLDALWLEHPNLKYDKGYHNRERCLHGIKCKGTRSITSTKTCTALHPWQWEMFPDAYIQYIIDLFLEKILH